MNKDTYAYLDGIPDRTSDLYNDGGFLNETEVQAEIGNYLDIDDATAGQVLTMGESGFPEWDDVASGITYPDVVDTEVNTGIYLGSTPIKAKFFRTGVTGGGTATVWEIPTNVAIFDVIGLGKEGASHGIYPAVFTYNYGSEKLKIKNDDTSYQEFKTIVLYYYK